MYITLDENELLSYGFRGVISNYNINLDERDISSMIELLFKLLIMKYFK